MGVGPLIDDIQDDLDASHALVGLLGTIPVLCMGLFAPVAAYLAARLGTRRAMTIGLALIGSFGVMRALGTSAWLVVLLTVPVGIGMGVGNALAPLVVREVIPERPATGTGVYTTGIQMGSTIAAAIVVPLAAVLGGWRGALIALSVAACVVAVAWVALERGGRPHVRPHGLLPRLPWRSGTAWLLVSIFALMGSAYYGLNAWLPDAYGERGWSDSSAGLLLAAMNLTAIATSFAVPWLSDRRGGRLPWLMAMAVVFTIGAVGLVAVPAAGYLWALMAGIAQGGMFALVMTLPLDLEKAPDRVAGLVALMLGVGYSIAAVSPFVLGGVRDLTGSFDAVLWVCVGCLVALLGAIGLLRRRVSRLACAKRCDPRSGIRR